MPMADQLAQLSQMPAEGGGGGAPAPMQGPPAEPQQIPPGVQQMAQQLGGPGVDTPQEQQAVQMLMQGALLFRRAAETDPSVAPIVDKMLKDSYLQITRHYGFEQEGKLALQQAEMQRNRMKANAFSSPAAQQGPPV